MPITLDQIVELHPRLYHMAEKDSWPNIQKHGLLSTSALLDLWRVTGDRRIRIEEERRPGPEPLGDESLGNAVIRDQHPLSDKKLAGSLTGGMTNRQWYKLLNSQVFFWLTEERLKTLMTAYNGRSNLVLEVCTEPLLREYWDKVKLSPMNSGATSPMAFPRGRDTFLPPDQYDFDGNRRKKGGARKAIVELTIEYGIPNIAKFVASARHADVVGNEIVTTEEILSCAEE